jgi:AraC-like DNA-binding protein
VLGYTGYAERTAPLRRIEAASARVVVIVSFGPELRVQGETRRSFAAGPSDGPTVTAHGGVQHGIQVDLAPLAARALLGAPPGELANASVELDALLGRRADELAERLDGAATWFERFALLDALLAHRLVDAPPRAPAVERAWARLVATHGRVPVAELAREAGWSRRHLGARFREELGLAPKVVARILRFERALRLLVHGRPLAETAFECGYADQAHLNRDFRAFVDAPPAAFLRRRLPDGGGFAAS